MYHISVAVLYTMLIAVNFHLVGSNVILVILCTFRIMQAENQT